MLARQADCDLATHSPNSEMQLPRVSGILLHPTSLPGPFGMGDFGPAAHQFVDFLADAGQTIWQILPLGLPAKGNSPYQSVSAFAGNPLLISPEKLVEAGYLSPRDITWIFNSPAQAIEFDEVIPYKMNLLRKAFDSFRESSEYSQFESGNQCWLNPFALFMALKAANGGRPWTLYDPVVKPDPAEIRFQKFLQFEFFRQWTDLKRYCRKRDISIMGDVPFYVEHDSADVWCNPELFDLDASGRPLSIGGVPPDYFSADGQLWGFPTYRWEKHKATDFRWWVMRLREAFRFFDFVRLDHFRGFEAYWQVAAAEKTARNGKWVKGPGAELFEVARRELGRLPIVAENLGVITEEVEQIRCQSSFPGMAVLQFAFGRDSTFRPHTYPRDIVAFTGTHDNDTVVGWWEARLQAKRLGGSQELVDEYQRTKDYLGVSESEIHWTFIRAVMASVANVAIFPLQDILGLGSEARMNVPGCELGNWGWRYRPTDLTSDLAAKLRRLTRLCDR